MFKLNIMVDAYNPVITIDEAINEEISYYKYYFKHSPKLIGG
ncbi:hypothetical protein [Clostridium estertheticum]|nr:hypothetical protein [Clostridium estertheticum]